MSFGEALQAQYPHALELAEFVSRSYHALGLLGFNADNTIASISVCRDEITRPAVDLVNQTWGEAFNLSSLAGLFFCGKTAFHAAEHHAPVVGGRERYLFVGFAHIGIGPGGEIGLVRRPGRAEVSGACGALIGFEKELQREGLKTDLDDDDLEFSLLRRRLAKKIPANSTPGLIDLVRYSYEAIVEDLERMIELTVPPDRADCALLTGIQIHGPQHAEYLWPGKMWARCGGVEQPVSI
ncbi:MAG: hypothetical protein JW797_17650 [Bradymonadales bacterium]|nr:hypothetical protein [Bradymonadales bacterium]